MTENEIQHAIDVAESIASGAAAATGQPLLGALAIALGEAVKAVDAAIQAPTANQVLGAEVDAEQAAFAAAEERSFGTVLI